MTLFNTKDTKVLKEKLLRENFVYFVPLVFDFFATIIMSSFPYQRVVVIGTTSSGKMALSHPTHQRVPWQNTPGQALATRRENVNS